MASGRDGGPVGKQASHVVKACRRRGMLLVSALVATLYLSGIGKVLRTVPTGTAVMAASVDLHNTGIAEAWREAHGGDAGQGPALAVLEELAPVVLKIDVCNGLTNQRIALIEGVLIGLVLGMQVLLPDTMPFDGSEYAPEDIDRAVRPLSDMYRMDSFIAAVDEIYRDYWCSEPHATGGVSRCGIFCKGESFSAPRKLWCGEERFSPIVTSASAEAVQGAFAALHEADEGAVRVLELSRHFSSPGALDEYRKKIFYGAGSPIAGAKRSLFDAKCTLFKVSVDESQRRHWDMLWRLDDALRYVEPVAAYAARLEDKIAAYGETARRRSAERGFPPLPDAPAAARPAYNVLHYRVEQDWLDHCAVWMGLRDGNHRDNCMNNTMNIANVLTTEGLDPRVPLYVSTGRTLDELRALRIEGQRGPGFQGLLDTFTVVTKDMLLDEGDPLLSEPRELSAAVDYTLATRAAEFVGNSVSTFSAFLLFDRQRRGVPCWHYNGGGVPLRDAGFLKPKASLAVPTLRTPLKWVFTINAGPSPFSQSFANMVKVAVISARRHTSLVPVCITTGEPTSELSRWLVGMGVRVVQYQPQWANTMRTKVNERNAALAAAGGDNAADKSHLFKEADSMIGTFLRVDVPVVGILDEFVLYTDVDVMFRKDVTWEGILGKQYGRAKAANDFASGRRHFSPTPGQGLPLFMSASSEMQKSKDPKYLNAGVMVLSMRSLRDTHAAFLDFILGSDIEYPTGPGDQGAIKSFYSRGGKYQINFLPWAYNYKSYWGFSRSAAIIHFHGPKCQEDIVPYMESGVVRMEVLRGLLRKCRKGACSSLCDEYLKYLAEA